MAKLPTSIIERLRATEKPTEHLDPDLIGAFVENSLNRTDRDRVFEHLAYCSQCREISALCLPEIPAAAPRLTASTWFSWPVLRWGAVAACLLAVAALSLRQKSSRPLPVAGSETPARQFQQPVASPVTATEASSPVAGKPAAPLRSALAAPTVAQAPKTGSGDEDAGVIAVTSEPIAPRTGLDKEARQEPLNSQLPQETAGAALAAAKMPSSAAEFATASVRAPRWTLSSDGTLERSFDAGTTWETVPLPSPARFHVLSAYGTFIWLGGSSGALYHSSDAGGHWTHVEPVANGQALTEDVIGMEFTDDDHGVLTTSTNQKWATEDCGQSWQKK
jgi:Photosynthesis system II assembly factor YCF48/Putative zinc-finger